MLLREESTAGKHVLTQHPWPQGPSEGSPRRSLRRALDSTSGTSPAGEVPDPFGPRADAQYFVGNSWILAFLPETDLTQILRLLSLTVPPGLTLAFR